MPISQQIGASSLIKPGVCTSTTRPASPYTGQVIFETDTNRMFVWNGSSWVIPNQTTQNPEGFEFIREVTASGTATTIEIVNCFSSTYDNYRIVMTNVSTPAANSIYWRAIIGSTPQQGVNYSYTNLGLSTRAASISSSAFDQTKAYLGFDCYNAESNVGAFDIYHPFLVRRTYAYGNTQGLNSGFNGFNMRNCASMYDSPVSIDGIQFLSDNSNITAKIRIYGYRNS